MHGRAIESRFDEDARHLPHAPVRSERRCTEDEKRDRNVDGRADVRLWEEWGDKCMDDGYVKLFRQIRKWRWYDDPHTKAVFMHCLVCANHADSEWRGEIIKAGSFVVGIEKMGIELGLTRQQTRTSINRLKSTNEITTKSTNKNTVINVVNWALYQTDKLKSTSKKTQTVTNEQPTNNQQITTNKNIKNDKNEKEVIQEQSKDADFAALALSDEGLYKLLQGFKDMRVQIKKPLTDNAKRILCKKLARWQTQGVDITEALENSIIAKWQGVFLPDVQKGGNGKPKANGANGAKPDYKIDYLDDYMRNLNKDEGRTL